MIASPVTGNTQEKSSGRTKAPKYSSIGCYRNNASSRGACKGVKGQVNQGQALLLLNKFSVSGDVACEVCLTEAELGICERDAEIAKKKAAADKRARDAEASENQAKGEANGAFRLNAQLQDRLLREAERSGSLKTWIWVAGIGGGAVGIVVGLLFAGLAK